MSSNSDMTRAERRAAERDAQLGRGGMFDTTNEQANIQDWLYGQGGIVVGVLVILFVLGFLWYNL